MSSHIIAGTCWRNPIPIPHPQPVFIRALNLEAAWSGFCRRPVELWGKRWIILGGCATGGAVVYQVYRVISIADARSCGIEPIALQQWTARERERRELSHSRWKGLTLKTAAGEQVVVTDEWRWVVCRLGEQIDLFGGAKR